MRGFFHLISQFSPWEAFLLLPMWLYEKTLGKRRQGVFELKRLYRDLSANPDRYAIARKGGSNIITIVSDLDIGDARVIVRRFSSDIPVFRQVLLKKQYKNLTDHIFKNKEEGSMQYIIDAGANTGCTTLFFKRIFPRAHIVSIEPEKSNYEIMLKNIALNNLEDIIPMKSALWNSDKLLEIDKTFRDKREWAFRVQPTERFSKDRERVSGVTIQELIKQCEMPRIDILKIDIEGGEQFVFADERDVDLFLPQVRYLAIEIHNEFGVRKKIMAMLEKHGFSYFRSGELTIGTNLKFSSK